MSSLPVFASNACDLDVRVLENVNIPDSYLNDIMDELHDKNFNPVFGESGKKMLMEQEYVPGSGSVSLFQFLPHCNYNKQQFNVAIADMNSSEQKFVNGKYQEVKVLIDSAVGKKYKNYTLCVDRGFPSGRSEKRGEAALNAVEKLKDCSAK